MLRLWTRRAGCLGVVLAAGIMVWIGWAAVDAELRSRGLKEFAGQIDIAAGLAGMTAETESSLRALHVHMERVSPPFYVVTLCISALKGTMLNRNIEPREAEMLVELRRRVEQPGFGLRASYKFLEDYPWAHD